MPQKTVQEILEEEEAKRSPPSVQELLSSTQAPTPTAVGGIPVETSPVTLPPDYQTQLGADPSAFRPGMSAGQTFPRTNINVPTASLEERALAAAGVDVRNELRDNDLRYAIGHSPNKAFTADFLAKELEKQTGLPANEVVRFGPTGTIEFFNPKTRRFTPVDSSTVTRQDLQDMYGPGKPALFATGGAMAGLMAGYGMKNPSVGIYGSIGGGAGGAFFGEMLRLLKGQQLGVHNLSTDDMVDEALRVAAVDVAAGIGGEGLLGIRRFTKYLLKPSGISAEGAEAMLEHLAKNSAAVNEINTILSRAGQDQRFVLPAPQKVKEATIGGLDEVYEQEVKEAGEVIEAATRTHIGVDGSRIVSRDDAAASPATHALRAERDRIQGIADDNVLAAERRSRMLLEQYGPTREAAEGRRLVNLMNVHSGVLRNTADSSWNVYQRSIGQPIKGSPGFNPRTEFTSNIKVPVSRHLIDTYDSAIKLTKDSLLSKKASANRSLKKPTAGGSVDLAVLDRDIKELRHLMRQKSPDFSITELKRNHDALVLLRNDYLKANHPSTLRLLEDAEAKESVYHRFIGDSAVARIFKPDDFGQTTLNDVTALRRVWGDKSGAAMGELVQASSRYFGGKAALQNSALRFYKANVTRKGSNVQSKELHDKFVEQNKDILDTLFDDPSMYQFGRFAANVERTTRRAKSAHEALRRSGLARIGGAAPEKMAKTLFSDSISVADVRSSMKALQGYPPEAMDSMRDAVGRELWSRITPDGNLSTKEMWSQLSKNRLKLEAVYGKQWTKGFEALREGLLAIPGEKIAGGIEKVTVFGLIARTLFNPPLTRRGRGQTLAETLRFRAANRMLHQAMREPRMLEALVRVGNKDATSRQVMSVLSQFGAVTLLTNDDLTPDYSPLNIPSTNVRL